MFVLHEPQGLGHLRVASGRDEVQAGMYTSVVEGDKVSPDLELLGEVGLKLLVDVFHDGPTAVLLVDLVPIPRCAHHRQTKLHIALFQVYTPRKKRKNAGQVTRLHSVYTMT